MSAPQLILYAYDQCPYCQKVLRVLHELKIEFTYNNTLGNVIHRQKLMQDTGHRTVPCLYIDGCPMHESSDIIAWLKENVHQLTKI